MIEVNRIYQENCLETMSRMPDNSIDWVCTDPPYGLNKISQKNVIECLTCWLNGKQYEPAGGGFMGKKWDAFVPGPEIWKELYRVMKPGAHGLVWGGTRTQDLLAISLRLAGFELKDCCMHFFGSGFKKGIDVSKAIDKKNDAKREVIGSRKKAIGDATWTINDGGWQDRRKASNGFRIVEYTAPNTDMAKKYTGFHSALKPSYESIWLIMKPNDGTYAENAEKWGVAGLNIDACRIGTNGESIGTRSAGGFTSKNKIYHNSDNYRIYNKDYNTTQGRWPANILFTHNDGCECVGWKNVDGIKAGCKEPIRLNNPIENAKGYFTPGRKQKAFDYTDKNGKENVPNYICDDGCPVKILDEQGGILKSGAHKKNGKSGNNFGVRNKDKEQKPWKQFDTNTGTASRFFYCAKSSRKERGKNNNHPTVKPLKLVEYFIKLLAPPDGGIGYDPFGGSGTMALASMRLGLNWIMSEVEPEYVKIAQGRIDAEKDKMGLFAQTK